MHEDWLVPVRSMAAKDLTPFPPESLGYVLNLVSRLSCLHAVIQWTERLIFLIFCNPLSFMSNFKVLSTSVKC